MSQENVKLVRRFTDAFNRRDRETFGALLHPEVEWHTFVGPVLGVAESMHGRDELLRVVFEQIPDALEDWQSALLEVSELPGGQVLAVGRYEAPGASSGAAVTMERQPLPLRCGNDRVRPGVRNRAEAIEAAGLSG